MEHKLTVITLSLNYSALTSLHLHSRHPRNSEKRGAFHCSFVRLDENRITGAAGGSAGVDGSCLTAYSLLCKSGPQREPREVVVK